MLTLYAEQQIRNTLKLYRKTIKQLTLTTKYTSGKIIIIYQRTCSAQAIEFELVALLLVIEAIIAKYVFCKLKM